jgi:hypothetical protein
MDPNQIQAEQLHYYVEMVDSIFRDFAYPFILTVLIYAVFLHIQFAFAWITNHKTSQGLKYTAFIKSKLKRKRIWAAFILIPVCINLFLWWGLSRYGFGFIMGPGPGIQVLTQAMEADRFVVRPSGDCLELPDNKDKVFETTDPNEILEFVKLLSFRPTLKGRHCNCSGELGFEFYKNNEVCLVFSFHHGQRIRVKNQSSGDLFLSDDSIRLLDNWLTEKGIWQRQKEWEESGPDIYDDNYQVSKDYKKTPIDPNSDNGRLLIQ